MLTVAHGLLLYLELAVEEDLLLFVLDHEAGLADRVAVIALLIVLLLVALFISSLGIWLAIEDHLLPRLEPLKDVKHILVLRVMRLAWAHESSVSEAIVLELALVLLSYSESLQAALILEFKTSLGCAILHQAENLDEEPRVLNDAPVPTDGLIGDIRVADFTFVLNLNELDVSDEPKHLDYVPDNLISRNRLDQLDLVVRLEVSHLVLDLTDDLEVAAAEHELDVDVNGDRNLAHGILDKEDHASLQVGFEVDPTAVLNEERHLTLVIRALQVNMTGHEVCATASRVVLQALVDLRKRDQD